MSQNPRSFPPYSNVRPPANKSKQPDVHELLKKEMYSQTGSGALAQGMSNIRERVSLDPVTVGENDPEVKLGSKETHDEGIYDTYLYCDSDFATSASNFSQGRIQWSVVELNQNQPLDNVIEMQIYNFYIPEITTGPQYPLYFFFKRVNILIEEMQSQSIRGPGTTRFHFEMDVQPSGIANLLGPASCDGKFTFKTPFRDLSSVTFSFTAPYKNVTFAPDQYTFNAVPGTAPARITTTVPHGLVVASQVSIFIVGFSSGTNIDPLVNGVNGQLVTVIDAVTLEFPAIGLVGFDFATILTAVPGRLYVGFRRIAFVLRMRSIKDGVTNRIVPI